MFKAENKRGFLIFISLIAYTTFLSGQTSTPEQKNKAKEEFDAGNYSDAYELYIDLMDLYPKDGLFNYYTGICLYKMDKDIPRSIEFLDYASSKPQVPEDVFYHLGQAYKKNYQFREAKTAFQKYENVAKRSEIRRLQPDLEIINAGNARELTLEYNPFEILATSLFTFSDTNYVKQVRGKGGTLSPKPTELLAKNEKKNELTAFMFIPKNIQKGDFLYTAGYSRSRQKDSDLFRLKKGGRNNFGNEEELEELNTDYNEILPYYDPVGKDLYFASEGHNSMGGFDVFKSHYDEERNAWSEPVNLGFPINSPDNEYFAMPGPDLGTILLITDRQGLDSMLTVYKLILQEPKKSLASADNEELKKIGNLGGISAIPSIIDIKEDEQEDLTLNNSEHKSQINPENLNDEKNKNEINIALALDYQKKADSLSMRAKQKRIEVRSMPDPNDRWAWQTQIIEWEKKARDYSSKADATFAMIENSRSNEINDKNEIPETIEKEREINGITVYRYKEDNGENVDQKEKDLSPELSDIHKTERKSQGLKSFNTEDEPGELVPPVSAEHKEENRFHIMNSSPYYEGNPFPVNIRIPDGAFYRIQLGVFSKKIDFNTFGGLTPVTAETIPDKSYTRYYVGKFSSYDKARNALNRVKAEGFSDAYIVSWYNGERVSLDKVTELEKRDKGN